MNQILATKPVKQSRTAKTKTVKKFFAISLIIYGLCMATSGSYAIYKDKFLNTNYNTAQKNTNSINTTLNQKSEKIQIHISNEDAIVHVTVIGQNEISFVTYRWDDEEETTVNVNSISDDIEIEMPAGKHVLTVTAVDIKNNSKTAQKNTKGITKPKLEVVQDGSEFLIIASDEVGLDKFEFILNGEGYLVRIEGEKEKEFRFPLEEGDNTLEVKAYNVDGVTEVFNAICHNY